MSEPPEKTTHAQRRRAESQDALRLKLKAAQYIRRLHEIGEISDETDAGKVSVLRLKADVYFKLLAKCLPDLRSIELTGNDGGPIKMAHELSDETLASIAAGRRS